MYLVNYLLTAFIANIGVILGIILAIVAKEEVAPGRRYFRIMKIIIFAMIIATLLLAYSQNIFIVLGAFIITLAILSFIEFKNPGYLAIAVEYAILGLIFRLSSAYQAYFIVVSCLIFLYGFPVGTLGLEKRHANKWKIILTSSSFLVTSAILFVIL